ncbi:MAG: CPBP family intramembrane metalloprotease [Armatimonadetes bacterium]|nr:CPBP family intramembrane metalloprotease [Anaerolineae bacterium]
MFKMLLLRIRTLDPAPPWGIVTALATLVAGFAAIVIGTTLTGLVFGQTALATVGGWSFGIVGIALFVTVTRNRTPIDRDALGLGEVAVTVLPITLLLGLGVAIALDLLSLLVTGVASPVAPLLVFFGGTPGAPASLPFSADPAAWLIAGLLVVLFQPIGEALMFHGVIYPALRQTLGAWMGFVMTGVFYGVFHLLAYTSSPQTTLPFVWYTLLLPLLSGLYLTAVRAYTKSTRAALAAAVGMGIFALLRALTLAG